MKFSIHARAVVALAALVMAGLPAGCSEQEPQTDALDVIAASLSTASGQQVGTAAAKGAELTAVAIVRGWVAARNEALGSGDTSAVDALTAADCGTCSDFLRGDRWSVDDAHVSQHTVDTATVAARVTLNAARHLALEFNVVRVAGKPVVTRIVVTS
jgi:hypothetical protein